MTSRQESIMLLTLGLLFVVLVALVCVIAHLPAHAPADPSMWVTPSPYPNPTP